MRIVKEAEVRKTEILDAANELFAEKGFDKTSTNDILQKVGIARGTLYYHFGSKEDIMDALIDRYTGRIICMAEKIAADKSIPLYERIVSTVMALNINNMEEKGSAQIIEHIHKPQNALMHQKIQKVMLHTVPPILADMIREGVKEGVFDTPFPLECMEMTIAYANTFFDDNMFEMTEEEAMVRITAFITNLERLLGAQEGSLMFVTQMFVRE